MHLLQKNRTCPHQMQKVRSKDISRSCQVCASRALCFGCLKTDHHLRRYDNTNTCESLVSEKTPDVWWQVPRNIKGRHLRRETTTQRTSRCQRNSCNSNYQQIHSRRPKHTNVLNCTSLGLIQKAARSRSPCLQTFRLAEQHDFYPRWSGPRLQYNRECQFMAIHSIYKVIPCQKLRKWEDKT